MVTTNTIDVNAASLELKGINYRYPGNEDLALSNIDVSVGAAQICALVGPSGCGKSTLLKTVGGIISPDEGAVHIGETNVTSTPMTKRQIGWVPQHYALFEHLDVKSNVAFGLRAQRYPLSERAARVREMLELCHMSEFADKAVDELSGGQRQRVAIARALAPYPRVLLLDEPLAALDPQLRGRLRSDLKMMIRDAGVTTIIVTHDQEEALAMADYLVVMQDGEVRQSGKPSEIWYRPGSAWIASFLGNAQIFPIERRISFTECEILSGLSLKTNGGDGDFVAVRSVDFDALDPDTRESSLGRVIVCEFRGDGYYVGVELQGMGGTKQIVPATSQKARDVGEAVCLRPSNRREIPEVKK